MAITEFYLNIIVIKVYDQKLIGFYLIQNCVIKSRIVPINSLLRTIQIN